MKLLIALICILPFQTMAVTPAPNVAPECINVGTPLEGWRMSDGLLITDTCQNKIAFCDAIGSKSEGWYSASVVHSELIRYENCAKDRSTKPACASIGNASEGWQFPDGKVEWSKCAGKIPVCGAIGTRSEGWYATTIVEDSKSLIRYANCK